MPDETATTATAEAEPAASTGAAPAAGAGAHGHDDPEPEKLPHLEEGSTDTQWVKFLQQMLNYYYQMQVVSESGQFDSQTAHVVSHYREQHSELPAGTHVDRDMWVILGVEDTHAAWQERQRNRAHGATTQQGAGHGEHSGGSFEPQHHAVSMISASNPASGWAAAMAMVLNFKGGSHTAESVCQHGHVDPNDFKSAREVASIGTELGLQQLYCDGTSATGWAQALHTGPLWTPNPGNDSNVIVVAGIDGNASEATVHVLDPAENYDDWMTFAEFHQHYAFGDNCELLG